MIKVKLTTQIMAELWYSDLRNSSHTVLHRYFELVENALTKAESHKFHKCFCCRESVVAKELYYYCSCLIHEFGDVCFSRSPSRHHKPIQF